MSLLDQLQREPASTVADLLERGYRGTNRRPPTADFARKVQEAVAVFEHAKSLPGVKGEELIREAFSLDDFVLPFNWYTDRQLLAKYQETPAAWQAFLKRGTLPDFRAAARDRVQGVDSPMLEVQQLGDYRNADAAGRGQLSGSRDTTLQVKKYGRKFPLAWESQINDVLEQLADLPERMALAARRTEQYQATAAYAANSTIYVTNHSVNGTTVSNKGTAALAIDALTTAINGMRSLIDDNGNPIFLGDKLRLVVPPQLELTAQRIVSATNLIWDSNPSAGTQKQRYETPNYLTPRLQVVVDYYLPILDATHGTTGWYLFADPGTLPAGEVVFLRGHEQPELFMATPNAVRISETGAAGGMINPMDGSFENDEIAYKVRHCVGAGLYEWRASYFSDGSA